MITVKRALAPVAAAVLPLALPLAAHASVASARKDAQGQVDQSAAVVRHMEKDPHIRALLHSAHGVLIIPRYGQGGLVVGGRGGEGVLIARTPQGRWSDPAFVNIGGVSLGAQAGGEGGSMALILRTAKALRQAEGTNNWALNAKAGLSVIEYSAKSQAGWGRADVVVWSDVAGAYAGATVGVSDVAQDLGQDRAYYGRTANVEAILTGKAHNPGARRLDTALG